MLKHFLKIYIRNLRKYKGLYFSNVLSLLLGISIIVILYFYVSFEYSYDEFHLNKNQIYRVVVGMKDGVYHRTSSSLGSTIENELPEVVSYVSLLPLTKRQIKYNDNKFITSLGYLADSNFFAFYSFPILKGGVNGLSEPNCIYLSEDYAKKLFGDEDPINKNIQMDYYGFKDYIVKGIYQIPKNSHLQFDWVASNHRILKALKGDWNKYIWFKLYLRISPNSNIPSLERKILAIGQEHTSKDERPVTIKLQPLKEVYFDTSENGWYPIIHGNKKILNLIVLFTICILVVIWINNINSIISNIIDRSKEIQIKKINGASHYNIFKQFYFETLFLSTICSLVAFVLLLVSSNVFESLFNIQVDFISLKFLLVMLFIIIINSIVLTIFNILILYGFYNNSSRVSFYKMTFKDSNVIKRSILLMQFILSIVLISYIMLINRQFEYMINYDLGVDIDNVMLITNPLSADPKNTYKADLFREELSENPNILNTTFSGYPGSINYGEAITYLKGRDDKYMVSFGLIDYKYIETFKIKLLEGRDFNENDKPMQKIIINKKFANVLGYNNIKDALYNIVSADGYGDLEIIGVVENYYQLSLDKPIDNLGLIIFDHYPHEYFCVRFDKMDNLAVTNTLAFIEDKYYKVFGKEFCFDKVDLKTHFNMQYQKILDYREKIGILTIIILLLCCTGVYSLFSYDIQKKLKSLAIRKCHGASFFDLLLVVLKSYYVLILIATIISVPIIYIISSNWLINYTNKIELSWMYFLIPAIMVFVLVLFTILDKLLKIRKVNIVETLKCE